MRDVQRENDDRCIPIDKVGVRNLSYPILLRDKAHEFQHTIARVNMYVNLPHNFRGTHMSRFVEILNEYRGEIAIQNIGKILHRMKEVFDAESAHVELFFPYFIEKQAPASNLKSLMGYNCGIIGRLKDKVKLYLWVEVPVNTVCPCSKEISEKGAHNQRTYIRVRVHFRGLLWIEDLIKMVEDCASTPVYALLKREDEKYVTEWAYEHPSFVEDVARNVAVKLNNDGRVLGYEIEVESLESIHNHNAYAYIKRGG